MLVRWLRLDRRGPLRRPGMMAFVDAGMIMPPAASAVAFASIILLGGLVIARRSPHHLLGSRHPCHHPRLLAPHAQ